MDNASGALAPARGIVAWLTPGISKANVSTLLFCAWVSMMLMPFIAFMQPMLLEEVLKIPREQHGTVTAILVPVNDVIVFTVMPLIGYLSDKIGRRLLFVFGVLLLSASIALYPFSSDVMDLVINRMFMGAGFAAMSVMIGAMFQDYPREEYRGKFLGISSIFSGLGVMFMAVVLTQIPEAVTARGYSQQFAVTVTLWVGAGFAVLAGLVGYLGLNRSVVAAESEKPRLLAGLRNALLAAKQNPRIRLSYVAGFASRGDLGVVGTLFPLWFMFRGREAGMESSDIVATSGMMLGIITLAGFLAGPAVGFLSDRMRRDVIVTFTMGMAVVAYTFTGFVKDPFDMQWIVPACILLGFSEVGAIVSCSALVGQEAPKETRGTIIGWYQVAGGVGITACVLVGGIIFDRISPNAPFLMMGAVNLVVVVLGIYTAVKHQPGDEA